MTKLIRVVRMTFQEDKVSQFLSNFDQNKKHIRNFEGCEHLTLSRDAQAHNIFYTYSIWESEDHLNAYRKSDLFKGVWANTKILFADKPQAFSMYKQETV